MLFCWPNKCLLMCVFSVLLVLGLENFVYCQLELVAYCQRLFDAVGVSSGALFFYLVADYFQLQCMRFGWHRLFHYLSWGIYLDRNDRSFGVFSLVALEVLGDVYSLSFRCDSEVAFFFSCCLMLKDFWSPSPSPSYLYFPYQKFCYSKSINNFTKYISP